MHTTECGARVSYYPEKCIRLLDGEVEEGKNNIWRKQVHERRHYTYLDLAWKLDTLRRTLCKHASHPNARTLKVTAL
jgi:hypothetical protein